MSPESTLSQSRADAAGKAVTDSVPMLGQLALDAKEGQTLRQSVTIEVVANSTGNDISRRFHYLHRARTGGRQLTHGIFYNGELIGALVWASPTFHHKKGLIPPLTQNEVIELARMWLSDKGPKLSETVTLGKALRQIADDWERRYGDRPKAVISFSDLEVSHEGVIYKAANFEDWGFAKSARLADAGARYSRNAEPYASGRYKGGTTVAPRSDSTKHLWLYWLDKEQRKAIASVERGARG